MLTYQWQVSTNGGNSFGNSTAGGYATANMNIPLTEARVGYQYRCKITDGDGNIVYSEPGKICTSAVIISHPEDSAAAYGERATFTVEAAGDGLIYQWQSSLNGTSWADSSAAGNATASMWVSVAEYNINYLYRCKVTDS